MLVLKCNKILPVEGPTVFTLPSGISNTFPDEPVVLTEVKGFSTVIFEKSTLRPEFEANFAEVDTFSKTKKK